MRQPGSSNLSSRSRCIFQPVVGPTFSSPSRNAAITRDASCALRVLVPSLPDLWDLGRHVYVTPLLLDGLRGRSNHQQLPQWEESSQVDWRMRELIVLALLSAALCGVAIAADNAIATGVFAGLTGTIGVLAVLRRSQ